MICESCERDIFRSCALSLKGKSVNCLVFHCDCPDECKGMDIRRGVQEMKGELIQFRITKKDNAR